MKKTPYCILLILLCTGCQVMQPKQRSRTYIQRIHSHAPSLSHNTQRTGHLKGQLFLKNPKEKTKHIAPHTTVILNPINPESQQWYQEVCKRGHTLIGSPSQAYLQALIQTKTSNQGEFIFDHVPTGEYYLVARAYWIDQKRYTGPVQYGGLMAKRVFIQEDQQQYIELNNQSACNAYFYFF